MERRELAIHTGRPERRAMAFTRIASAGPLCVANLHATNDRPELATADVLRAAEAATEWAGDSPLLFGGDLNLRPAEDPGTFEALRERFGLTAPPTRARSTTCSPAISRSSTRRRLAARASASSRRDGLRSASPTTLPSGKLRFKTGSP